MPPQNMTQRAQYMLQNTDYFELQALENWQIQEEVYVNALIWLKTDP